PIHIPDHTLEEIWGEAQVPGYVRAEVDGGARCDRAVTRKVGFLFLVLRNAGNIALTNINIQSLEFPPGSIDPSIWSIAESERIEHFEEMATNPAFAAFAGQIGAGEARSRNAPNLQPGQSFIWLISVYRTTPDFYEA